MAAIKGNICSQPGKQLFPAWENIVPCLGKYCSLGRAQKETKGGHYGHLVIWSKSKRHCQNPHYI